MGEGYRKRRTHWQQVRYERWLLLVFTFIGLLVAAGTATMALVR